MLAPNHPGSAGRGVSITIRTFHAYFGAPGRFDPGQICRRTSGSERCADRPGLDIADIRSRLLLGAGNTGRERPHAPREARRTDRRKRNNAANGYGRVPAGAELHHAGERVAASGSPRRFHDRRLLPENRPGAGGRQVPACLLRRPPGDARHLRRQPGRGGRQRRPRGQDRSGRHADGDGLRHATISASDRPLPPPTTSRSTSPAGSRPWTTCSAAAPRGTW